MAAPSIASVTARVRERVRRHISMPITDGEALKLCLVCATVEPDALLELSHDRVVSTQAIMHLSDLALTPEEFDTLFSDAALTAPRRTALAAALSKEEATDECQAQHTAIEGALRLTLTEAAQKKRWKESARTRAHVLLAMLRKDGYLECLGNALGGVLGCDHRRIDDLRAQTEEEGIDLIAVNALIQATCQALTAT
tara:strand:+ start:691 stop:1281 length:591 start_codon:yes stop_codon:yes gene_type:complete